MNDAAEPPARLLEQITAQQARVADLERALAVAERAVRLADSAAAGARRHRRADAALMDLEAAETVLDRLLHTHAATALAQLPPQRGRRGGPGGVVRSSLTLANPSG